MIMYACDDVMISHSNFPDVSVFEANPKRFMHESFFCSLEGRVNRVRTFCCLLSAMSSGRAGELTYNDHVCM